MGVHIIVDGYNLIQRSMTLSGYARQDLQAGREALLDLLRSYKKIKGHRITVVFDAWNAPSWETRREQWKGIDVRFSREGELADAVIERMAAKERQAAVVVTSDRQVAQNVASKGSSVMSADDFERRVVARLFGDQDDPEDEMPPVGRHPTKKKGPSRRAGRKQRRMDVKTRKL